MIITLNPENNKSILQQLQELGLPLSADCGGRGRCGRCKLRLLEGRVAAGDDDLAVLGKSKCDEGWRLACRAFISEPVKLELQLPGEAKILTETDDDKADCGDFGEKNKELCIAVDLGTTTVAVLLLDSEGKKLASRAFINPQTAFGADVISRIQASNDGKSQQLRSLICNSLSAAIRDMLKEKGFEKETLKLVALAGNTTMLHLLRGYSCEGLAAYPFEPVSLNMEHSDAASVLGEGFEKAKLVIFPGISAFIGADITAGIYGSDLTEATEATLFMDLGTNGEMVLSYGGKLLTAAAAAGPAFEGANLSCGMGCVTAAVESVRLERTANGRIIPKISVVGNVQPEGICGSGALELLSELIRLGIVDRDGTLIDEYFEKGFPFGINSEEEILCLTQKDIRELQLAKASVRAAAELLIRRVGVTPKILLAGGMGKGLGNGRLDEIGLFPENTGIRIVGNSCLKGLIKFITESMRGQAVQAKRELEAIAVCAEETAVAGEADFQELFLKYMGF